MGGAWHLHEATKEDRAQPCGAKMGVSLDDKLPAFLDSNGQVSGQEESLKSFLGFSSVSALIGLSRGTSYSVTQPKISSW